MSKHLKFLLISMMLGNLMAGSEAVNLEALNLLCSAGQLRDVTENIEKIVDVDLSQTNINELAKSERKEGLDPFASFWKFFEFSVCLESLSLRGNKLNELLGSEWKVILSELAKCPRLRVFNLSLNCFGVEIETEDEFWFDDLDLLEFIEELDLSENSFGASEKKARAVSLNVAKMKRLKSLNFSLNQMERLPLKAQLEVVGNFCESASLRSIDFTGNDLSSETEDLLISKGFRFCVKSGCWIRHPFSLVSILKIWLILV